MARCNLLCLNKVSKFVQSMSDLIKFVQIIVDHVMLCMYELGEVPRLQHVDQINSK